MKSQRQCVVIPSSRDMHTRTEAPPAQDEQKQYWDNRWDRAKDDYPHAWARQRGAAVLAMLRSLSFGPPRILDMGCGTGWFTEERAGIGEATGVELSEVGAALARSRYPHATFIAGNVLEMTLPAA